MSKYVSKRAVSFIMAVVLCLSILPVIHFSEFSANASSVLYGDVNSDGRVNPLDRTILTRYLARWKGYDSLDLKAADVNLDGKVNSLDRTILTRHLAKWKGYDSLPYITVDNTDSNNWKKVVNNVFTSDGGGIQLIAPGWKTYGVYSISMVPEEYNVGQTNAICVAAYDRSSDSYDSYEEFESLTEEYFEGVLLIDIDSFVKTTISYDGKSYTCYKVVVTGVYYVWLFQTENAKYFINFMQHNGQEDMQIVGEEMMSSIRIYEEPQSSVSQKGVIKTPRTETIWKYTVDTSTFEVTGIESRDISYIGTVRIGNTAATSGVYASVGIPYNTGLEAYINDINYNGGAGGFYDEGIKGYYVEFIHYDDDFDSAYGYYYTKELVEEDEVFALVGHFGSPTVGATIDYIKQKGVIACYFASGVDALYNTNATSIENGSTLFPVQPIYSTEGRIIVGRIIEQYPSARKIGIVYTSDEAGMGIMHGAVAQISAVGSGYSYVLSETEAYNYSFTSAVNKVANCDVVIVASIQKGVIGIINSMIDNGISKPVFISYSSAANSTLTEIQSKYNSLPASKKFPIYSNAWLSSVDVDSYLLFCYDVLTYTADYDLTYNSYAMAGWIAADIFIDGLFRTIYGYDDITTENYVKAMEDYPVTVMLTASATGESELDYSDGYRIGITRMTLLKNNSSCDAFEEYADMKDFMKFIKSGKVADAK